MDWMDDYLDGMQQYKVTVSPADTHIWGPAKPGKQQQSMIQDSMAFDIQQMRLIQEARRELEEHGPSSVNASDPGSSGGYQIFPPVAYPGIWLDSSRRASVLDASGNPCASNTPAATWLDLSTNNRHFAQSNSLMRPTLSSYQGMNYLKFDSSISTHLNGNTNSLTFGNNVAGITLICVAQFGNPNTGIVLPEAIFTTTRPSPGGGNGSRIKFMSNPSVIPGAPANDEGWYFAAGGRRLDSDVNDKGAPADASTATFKNNTAPGIITAKINYAANTVNILFNGAAAGTDTNFQTAGNSSTTNAAKVGIGRRFVSEFAYFNGVIGEFFAYERILTDAELTTVNSYLTEKWSL